MMSEKKRLEGEQCYKEAEKHLKTSLTKWSADHDSAADAFSKAATNFKVAKEYERALEALDRACTSYKQCKSLYQAGKMLEQAVLIARDSNKLNDVASLAERGALLYRQHGSPESAAQLLEKAAKIVEGSEPEVASELLAKAADTVLVEHRNKQAAEYMSKGARLLVKRGLFNDAYEALRKSVELYQSEADDVSNVVLGKVVTSMVLIKLRQEDTVAAQGVFNELGGYCDTDQSGAINTIIAAYDEDDVDEAKRGLNSAAVKNLDVEYARMAREIKLPEGGLEDVAKKFAAQRMADKEKEDVVSSNNDEKDEKVEDDKEETKEHKATEEDDEDDLC